MVRPTTGPHGSLLERAKTWEGLAGVPHPSRTGAGGDEPGGQGGDTRQVPQEVECRAFRRQERRHRTRDGADHISGFDGRAVEPLPHHRQRGVDLTEGLGGAGGSGDDTGGPGDEPRLGPGAVGQDGGRKVAQRRQILGEGSGDGGGDVAGRRLEVPGGCRHGVTRTRGCPA